MCKFCVQQYPSLARGLVKFETELAFSNLLLEATARLLVLTSCPPKMAVIMTQGSIFRQEKRKFSQHIVLFNRSRGQDSEAGPRIMEDYRSPRAQLEITSTSNSQRRFRSKPAEGPPEEIRLTPRSETECQKELRRPA